MEQIIITKRDGSRVPILSRHTATNITSAKQNWTLNGDDTVDITVKSPYPQKYDIGDKITIFGRDYTLNRLPRPKKTGAFAFEYTLQFEGVQYDLLRASYDVTIDTTNNQLQDVQGDSLTGDLRRFLTVLVANANRVFPGKWSLGECPDTASDVTLTFGESDNCLSVLQSILGKFDESYFFDIEISGGRYIINIKTKSNILPFTLEFGKGNGLYMLSRDNVSSANIITRLKVYGSTSNITNKYRADRLCLPGKSKGQSYIEKPEAVAKYGIFEGRKHFENIKPTFTGHVQSVGESGVEFIDTSISFDLNAKEADGVTTRYLIDGVNAKIHFNSGNLAGYEFDIVKYDHATHKVTLRRFTDDRGDVFPSETSLAFKIGVGNEYKILNIALPPELEAKAEAELEEAGNKYYDQNSQPKVQYSLSVTRAFIEKHFATDAGIVNVFIPGNYVPIKDPDIGVDKSVRIKSITRNILNPYEYSLTISDTVTTSVTNRVISDIIDIDKIIEINNLNDHARARANWRSSREVLDMVFDPEGDYYTDKIKPNSIDTLALSVGAKSMQFALSNTIFKPNYGGDVNVMKWQGGVLTHYTISEESARSWNIQDGEITFNESSRPYYIYAKCSKSSEQGQFVITEKQYKVEQEPDCYYFWVGVVNSVDADIKARTLSLLYGFTTINGRYIKTGRIESSGNGQSFFDLDSNQFVLGDCLSFNKDNDKRLLLKGTFVQSTSGDESPLPCYRGVWNASIVYFTGDTVIYAIDGKYSLYQCVKQCKNITPNNHADYWVCQASAGSDGKDGNNGKDGQNGNDGTPGDFVEFRYAVNGSTVAPTTPAFTPGSIFPTNYFTTQPEVSTGKYLWMIHAVISGDGTRLVRDWSVPIRITPFDGKNGSDGKDGAPGDNGVGIESVTNYYGVSVNSATKPTSWTTTTPTMTSTNRFLWNYEVITYTDNTKTETTAHIVGVYGATGSKGDPGKDGTNGVDGEDGVGIKSIKEYYLATSASSGVTRNTSGWTTSVQTINSTKKYLWNYECVTFTDNTFHYTDPVIIGVYGDKGDKGDPGKSPAMVFRGDYNSNKIYYGNEHRLDCVKYNGAYYIARIDAGTFTNVAPTNTSKWNPFGASFESVATELLLAENANIANLIFRNQRLESSATSNGVPNFFIDGFNNIASFAAGNVAFDKTGAKIGWLRVVGKDLIGYDDNGITRLRLTPDALPPVTSRSTKLANVSGSGGNSDVTTEVDQNESFYAEKFVHQYTNRDDGNFDDDGSMSCWVDIDIPAASTTLYLSDMQFGVMDAKSLSGQHVSPNVQIYASVKYKNGNTIGSVDLSNGNAQITIPTAGTVRLSITVSCNYGVTDWNGRAYVSFQGFPISGTANNTVIAKDGIMATFNGNYMRMHSSEGFSVKVGNNYFRITSSGIQKSTNGSTWTNL